MECNHMFFTLWYLDVNVILLDWIVLKEIIYPKLRLEFLSAIKNNKYKDGGYISHIMKSLLSQHMYNKCDINLDNSY